MTKNVGSWGSQRNVMWPVTHPSMQWMTCLKLLPSRLVIGFQNAQDKVYGGDKICPCTIFQRGAKGRHRWVSIFPLSGRNHWHIREQAPVHSLCIKYRSLKHNKFVSSYLGLVELFEASANGIANAIVGFLEECGLDIKNMVAIATDGASVMVGRNHSVFTLLKQKQPNLQLIRCICQFALWLLADKEKTACERVTIIFILFFCGSHFMAVFHRLLVAAMPGAFCVFCALSVWIAMYLVIGYRFEFLSACDAFSIAYGKDLLHFCTHFVFWPRFVGPLDSHLFIIELYLVIWCRYESL